MAFIDTFTGEWSFGGTFGCEEVLMLGLVFVVVRDCGGRYGRLYLCCCLWRCGRRGRGRLGSVVTRRCCSCGAEMVLRGRAGEVSPLMGPG